MAGHTIVVTPKVLCYATDMMPGWKAQLADTGGSNVKLQQSGHVEMNWLEW